MRENLVFISFLTIAFYTTDFRNVSLIYTRLEFRFSDINP